MDKRKKIYFTNLDSLRFIGALMVFFSHEMPLVFKFSNINSPVASKIWDLISCGYIGVSIFFVLSGFLITYLLLQEKDLTNRIDVKKFYVRRILRIWPLYFLVLLISFVLFPFHSHSNEIVNSIPSRLPYYLAFLSNFDLIHAFKYHLFSNTNYDILRMQFITWSVSVEEQFYLVWPLLFILIKARYYIFIFVIVILASLLFRLYHCNQPNVLDYHTFSVAGDLSFGGLSAYLILRYSLFQRFFSQIPPWVSFIFYIFGFSVLLYREHLMYFIPYFRAFIRLFYGIFFSFIILDQNYAPQSFLKLGRYKLLSFWGRYSYGVYLLHPIAIGIVAFFVYRLNIIYTTFFNYLIIGLTTLILTLAMSYVSYEFFEKKFLALKKKFSVI